MDFVSDNTAGCSEPVLAAIAEAATGRMPAYGSDDATASVARRFAELFEREVDVFLVPTGTAANALSLAAMTRPWGAVLTHGQSHVMRDECGAPEFFSAGAKLVPLPGIGGRIDPAALTRALHATRPGSIHQVEPQAVSITQATESGLVLRPGEIAEIAEIAHASGLKLHLDGARFGNAVAASGCSPAELSWRAGVDIMSFGGTKLGALAAEAIIVFDPGLAGELSRRRKRAGHTLSKGRLLAAQFEGLLAHGHWLDLAAHANAMARRLAEGIARAGVRLAWPCQANAVFPVLTAARAAALKAAGLRWIDWSAEGIDGPEPAPGETIGRLVCSFATTDAEIEAAIAAFGAPPT